MFYVYSGGKWMVLEILLVDHFLEAERILQVHDACAMNMKASQKFRECCTLTLTQLLNS